MKKRNRKFGKRALAMFVSLTMCLGMLQITAFAVEGEEDDSMEKVSEVTAPEGGYELDSNTIPDNSGSETDPAEDQEGVKEETQTTTTEWKKETEETTETTSDIETAQDAGEAAVEGQETGRDLKEEELELEAKGEADVKLDLTVDADAKQGGSDWDAEYAAEDVQKELIEGLRPAIEDLKDNGNGTWTKEEPVTNGTKVTTVKEVKDEKGNVIGYTTTVRTETKTEKPKENIDYGDLQQDVLEDFQKQNSIPKVGDEITRADGRKVTVTDVEEIKDAKGYVTGYKVKTESSTGPVTGDPKDILTDEEKAGSDVVHNTLESAPQPDQSYTFADGKEATVTRVTPVYADDDPTKLIGYTVEAEVRGEQYTDAEGNPVVPVVTRTETISLTAKEETTEKTSTTTTTTDTTSETSTIYVYYDAETNSYITEEVLTQTAKVENDTLSVKVDMGEVKWENNHGIMYEEAKKVDYYHEYDEIVKKEVFVPYNPERPEWGGTYKLVEETVHHKVPMYATDENGDYVREEGKYEVVPGSSFGDRVKNLYQATDLEHLEEKFNLITGDDIKATGVTVTQNSLKKDDFTTTMKVDLSISKSQLTDSYLYLDIQDQDGKTVRRAYLTDEGKAYWKGEDEKPQEVNLTIDENTGAITGVEFTDVPAVQGENAFKLQLFGYQKTYAHKNLGDEKNPVYGTELEYTKSGLKIIDDSYTVIDLQATVTVTINTIAAKIDTEHMGTETSQEDHVYTRQEVTKGTETVKTTEKTLEEKTTVITDTRTTNWSLTHSTVPGRPSETPETPEEPETPERPEPPERPETPGTPETPIDDTEVPLAELPEEVAIPEEEVPLAELPEEEPEEVEIPEEDVPLADVPETGDISAMWYVVTLLSACGLIALNTLKKREEA